MRILDLATGTGANARAAARRGGLVAGVDRSRGMLAVARELAPEVEFRVADASALPFEPGTFDAVFCGLSLSHFANRKAVMREVLRVLRPGAPFVASAWGKGSLFPTSSVDDLLERYPSASAALDEETWLSPDRGKAELRRGGFAEVVVTRESFRGRFTDPDEALGWWTAWPLTASKLALLDVHQRERFFCEARAVLRASDLSWRFAFNVYLSQKP